VTYVAAEEVRDQEGSIPLSKQCLDRRIADLKILMHEVSAWEDERNSIGTTVRWQFKRKMKETNSKGIIKNCRINAIEH